MPAIRIPNGWSPRWYQRPSWDAWEQGCKRELLIWHRRAGKDDVALHKAAVAAHLRPATYWHMLPEYAQARKAIWAAVNPHTGRRRIDEAFPLELRANTNEQEMFIRFKTGATWQVVGSDRYNSLVGTPPAGVVLSEWALANPSAWAYLAPILAENGGWATFITTPRGRNHVKTMLDMARNDPRWFTEVLTVEDTKAISLETVEEQRKDYHSLYGADAGDALIEQEYWCSFEAAILGAYWGKEMIAAERAGRITDVPLDEAVKVDTVWDLGIDDSMALWFFQICGAEIHLIDYHEASGHGFEHYAHVKRDKGYDYGMDWVPHDARVRELGTGRTRIETMKLMGFNPRLVPDHKVMDGINAARQTLPRCWFDAVKCERGIECLRQYRAEWDDDKKVFKERPLHDWASHGADAFRYLSMAWREMRPTPAPPPAPPMRGIREMTFAEALKRVQRPKRTRI
ncbi:hypothetical protein [Inquilinus limosus]|uniref:hypothetical protein n=1 Tax=Inquilinus limosus TaxID=171674 RepID=UPI00068DB2A1|nr:hypothetical protein [Inquilinus limosus]